MRAQPLRPLAIAGVLGAAAGAVVALVGRWWVARDAPENIGFSSYSALDNATNRLLVRRPLADGWFALLWPALLTGLVVGILAVAALTVRRGGRRPLPPGARGAAALVVTGIVLGAGVGGVLLAHAGAHDDEEIYYGRYVPLEGPAAEAPEPEAYDSNLSVTLDEEPDLSLVAVCAVTGLALGSSAAAVITVARRRRIPRETAGAA